MPEHECDQRSKIESIERRLGNGDVKLSELQMTCNQILEQTKKTNGRVTRSEEEISDIKMSALTNKYTWKMVVKDVLVAVVSVGGIVFALTRILGG